MGFLQQDTNNIILDAVLTNEGRRRLAANDGTFQVVAFSLGDDEVDYGVITRFGRAVGREKIEKNTPVFEALTNANLESSSRLVTIADDSLFALTTFSITSPASAILNFDNVSGAGAAQQAVTVQQVGALNQAIPPEIQDTVLVVTADNRFLRVSGLLPFQTVGNVDYYNVVLQGARQASQSLFEFRMRPQQLIDADFTTFGNSANKTQITTFVRIQGRQSGQKQDLKVLLNK